MRKSNSLQQRYLHKSLEGCATLGAALKRTTGAKKHLCLMAFSTSNQRQNEKGREGPKNILVLWLLAHKNGGTFREHKGRQVPKDLSRFVLSDGQTVISTCRALQCCCELKRSQRSTHKLEIFHDLFKIRFTKCNCHA